MFAVVIFGKGQEFGGGGERAAWVKRAGGRGGDKEG